MRNIKFRAYDNKDDSFLYFTIKDAITKSVNLFEDMEIDECIELKDITGMDIYEGDLLKTDNGYYTVYYSEPCFMLEDENGEDYNNGDYYDGNNPYSHRWAEFRIVGNKHKKRVVCDL